MQRVRDGLGGQVSAPEGPTNVARGAAKRNPWKNDAQEPSSPGGGDTAIAQALTNHSIAPLGLKGLPASSSPRLAPWAAMCCPSRAQSRRAGPAISITDPHALLRDSGVA